jgi:hypothetical protein
MGFMTGHWKTPTQQVFILKPYVLFKLHNTNPESQTGDDVKENS